MFAARGHDRRSPPVKSQGSGRMRTGTGPETTSWSRSSPARHDRADLTDEATRSCSERPKRPSPFTKMEASQRIGFEMILSFWRLSASRRPTTRQMVAERGGRPNGPGRRRVICSVIKGELLRLWAHAVARHHSRPSMTGAPPFRNLRNRSHG